MSATLSGIIVLENATAVEGLPSTVSFYGQVWLRPGRILTGLFRHYNANNLSFPDVGHFFTWVHVCHPSTPFTIVINVYKIAKFLSDHHGESTAARDHSSQHDPPLSDDDSQVTSTVASLSTDVDRHNSFHVAGDILQLIPLNVPDPMQQSFINVTGCVLNSNKADGIFDIDARQYTTLYKNTSSLPVRAHFNSTKYKGKKPTPSDKTFVSVEGALLNVETDPAGHVERFIITVDYITFLGKATVFPPPPTSTGTSSFSSPHPFSHCFVLLRQFDNIAVLCF
jgi:hypothetical protein